MRMHAPLHDEHLLLKSVTSNLTINAMQLQIIIPVAFFPLIIFVSHVACDDLSTECRMRYVFAA